MELKFEKKATQDEKKPNYLVLIEHADTTLGIGELTRTTYKSEVGDIPCWKFTGNFVGDDDGHSFMCKGLGDAKEKIALRLMGIITQGLEPVGRAAEIAEITRNR